MARAPYPGSKAAKNALAPAVLGFSRANCSVGRTLEIVGERWTILVLREAFYGVRRFDEMLSAVGCARNILSDRLAKLLDEGVLRRTPYRDDGQRERYEYRLTDKGLELFPVLLALLQWGDKWLADAKGPPVEVHHRACQTRVSVEIRCAEGHGPLGPRDTEPLPTAAARRLPRKG